MQTFVKELSIYAVLFTQIALSLYSEITLFHMAHYFTVMPALFSQFWTNAVFLFFSFTLETEALFIFGSTFSLYSNYKISVNNSYGRLKIHDIAMCNQIVDNSSFLTISDFRMIGNDLNFICTLLSQTICRTKWVYTAYI